MDPLGLDENGCPKLKQPCNAIAVLEYIVVRSVLIHLLALDNVSIYRYRWRSGPIPGSCGSVFAPMSIVAEFSGNAVASGRLSSHLWGRKLFRMGFTVITHSAASHHRALRAVGIGSMQAARGRKS